MKYKIAQAVSVILIIVGVLLGLQQVFNLVNNKELSPPFFITALALIIGASIVCGKARKAKYLQIINNLDGEETIYLLKTRYDYLEKKGMHKMAELSFANYCEQVIEVNSRQNRMNPLHLASLISLAGDPGIVLLRQVLLRFDVSLLAYIFAKARIDKKTKRQEEDITSYFILDTIKFNRACNARIIKASFCEEVIKSFNSMNTGLLGYLDAKDVKEEISLFETRTKPQILNYKIKKQKRFGKRKKTV